MHVGLGDLRVAARAYGPDGSTFGDVGPLRDPDGAELEQGDGKAIRGLDRDGRAARRHRAREAHLSGRRRENRRTHGCADVDPPVLPTGVRVRDDVERSQHRPVHGPGPGERGLHADLERKEGRKQDEQAFHPLPPRCPYWKQERA
jgi:hypothetical protein